MNTIIRKIPAIIICLAICYFLKNWIYEASLSNLNFILAPVNYLLESILGMKSTFVENTGYYFGSLNIVINKTCSGFNFFLMVFGLFSALGIYHYPKIYQHVLVLTISIVLSYIFTILINSFRIYTSILIEEGFLNSIFSKRQHFRIHNLIGLLTNFTFLILLFFASKKALKSFSHE